MTPMSPPEPPDGGGGGGRTAKPTVCRRCGSEVPPERHQSEDGVTWIWRCACGWASARTESGVVSRARAREAVARALERLDDPGTND
jgi:hypothetical protein